MCDISAIPGGARAHPEADREMVFAHTGRAGNRDCLTTIRKTKLGRIEDDLAIQAGLFFEVAVLNPPKFGEFSLLDAAVWRKEYSRSDPVRITGYLVRSVSALYDYCHQEDSMRIALVQQHATADCEENVRRGLEALSEAAGRGAKLVCYAELAFEPFYPQHRAGSSAADPAQPVPGPITEAFSRRAADLGVVVVINLYERDGKETYDCSPVIDADGTLLGRTRMIHITDYACFHEKGYYTPGDTGAPVYSTRIGRIGVATCYDRHYPEYMRALALNGAQLVVTPQAGSVGEWPEGLFEAEMRVAAFQNGYFTALCNRVGREERLTFAGESFVCDPAGRVVVRAPSGQDCILYADINLAESDQSHARNLFMRDRRPELYREWVCK